MESVRGLQPRRALAALTKPRSTFLSTSLCPHVETVENWTFRKLHELNWTVTCALLDDPLDCRLRRVGNASRLKLHLATVRGSGESAGEVDESVTRSANFFCSAEIFGCAAISADRTFAVAKLRASASVESRRRAPSSPTSFQPRFHLVPLGLQPRALHLGGSARRRRIDGDSTAARRRRRRVDLLLRPPLRRRQTAPLGS